MGTKAALTRYENDLARAESLHRGVHQSLDDQATVMCAVCEKRMLKAFRTLGDMAICVWCTKNNGEKLARIRFFVRALSQLPCENLPEGAADTVVVLNCKCVPCTARSVHSNERTTYGRFR